MATKKINDSIGYSIEEEQLSDDNGLRTVRINILDDESGEASEEVDVYTSADAVNFSNGRNLPEEIDYQFAYTNTNKMPADLGGLPSGTSFVSKPIKDVLNSLLYPYVKPEAVLTASNTGSYFEEGIDISPISFTVTVTKKSEDIKAVSIYKSGAKVADLTIDPEGGVFRYTYNSPIDSNSTFTARVTDKKDNTITTNAITFLFNKPIYYGPIKNIDSISGSHIQESCARFIDYEDDHKFDFIAYQHSEEECFFFAFPFEISRGEINVYDPNGFNITSSFSFGKVAIQSMSVANSVSIEYTYMISNVTSNDFNLTVIVERK